ncbi:MAG: Fe-S cluster protein [Planctomycetes bacterium]|nr:Fe-S cluster protein [Planctomycetota bacterium]
MSGKGRLDKDRLRVVLYEGPGAAPLADEARFETLVALLEDGHQVTRPAAGTAVAAADDSQHLVLGRFDDASAVNDAGFQSFDISDLDPAGVLEGVKARVSDVGADQPGGWKPWFPVIDYDRCTNCMQCLTFCLFDVYGVDGQQQIDVQHEDKCKTDCPACSRVCPEAAIMFPKYKKGPINGDVVREEDLQNESMKVDISALLGGDIYSALRTRQSEARQRFSTERDESKALLERKRCLAKLKKNLDIPDEVLMTLPSVGDIQDRARRAREKAERRQDRSQTMKDRRPTEDDWGI